jgi:hypothetical protein
VHIEKIMSTSLEEDVDDVLWWQFWDDVNGELERRNSPNALPADFHRLAI